MSLREIAMQKKFYLKKGKALKLILQNILMEYCRSNNFELTEDDKKFVDEWFLNNTYKLWKYQYDHGMIH